MAWSSGSLKFQFYFAQKAVMLMSALRMAALAAFILFFPASDTFSQDGELWTYTRFRYENDDRGSQNYLMMYNDLKLTDIVKDRLEARFSGWFNINSGGGADSTINYDYLRVSQAYLLFKFPEPNLRLSLGRQYIEKVDCFNIDGLHADLNPSGKQEYFLFGGRPVSFYSSTNDEYMFGGGMIFRPWWQTSVQLDAFALKENDVLYDAAAIRLNQYLPLNTRAYGRLRLLQDGVRDIYATLSSFFEEYGVSSNISYFVQPQTRGTGNDAASRDFSHYGQIFNASYAFQQAGLQLQKYTGDKWIINGGAMIKRLLQDPGTYAWPVDSNVFNAGLTRLDLFIPDLDMTVLGNYVDNKNDWFFDVTGELDYKITKGLSAAVGMTYTGYQFAYVEYPDTLNGQSAVYNLADHVGSKIYFVDFRYSPTKSQRITLAGSYEAIDQRYSDAIVLQIGYQHRFDLAELSKKVKNLWNSQFMNGPSN
ncbi:MAG: hypothetical protein HY881_17790 [Deltaproteobacteria bacterium]|nr:hypothetical protein [Deltaproteobacteria bacterium]